MTKIRKSAISFFVAAIATFIFGSCSSQPVQQPIIVSGPPAQQAAQVQQVAEAPQTNVPLDLSAIGALFRQAPNASELERLLNDPSTGINNLDQNSDGQVDYLQVQEWANQYGRGVKIYDISLNPALEVASIKVPNAVNGTVQPQIVGGASLYGPNYIYNPPAYSLSDALFLSWLLQPHTAYVSPYRYGYYAPYYHPYSPVPTTVYRQRVVTRYRTVTAPAQTNRAPAAATPAAPKRELTGTNQYDKNFQVTDRSRGLNNEGFKSQNTQSTARPAPPATPPAKPAAAPQSRPTPPPSRPTPPVSRPSSAPSSRRR